MILHTLNKPPSSTDTCNRCLDALQSEDALLLIENGVYAAILNDALSEKLTALSSKGRLYVLADDFAGRGLSAERLVKGAQLIGHDEFVALVCQHDKCVAWF